MATPLGRGHSLSVHRLSASEDLSFLRGAEILQICVGVNELILNAHDRIAITILGDFSVGETAAMLRRFEDPRDGAPYLFPLLHDSIAAAEATPSGDLRLRFESGAELVVYDDSDQYESFTIQGPDRAIVV